MDLTSLILNCLSYKLRMIIPVFIYLEGGRKDKKDNVNESAFKGIINDTGAGNYHCPA